MNSKILSLFAFGVLVLVLAMSAVSADIVFNPSSATQTINLGTTSAVVSFNLVHTGAGGDYSGLTWTGNSTLGTWTLPTAQTTLNTSQNISLTATLTGIPSTFTGTITGNITVTASGGSPTETIPITITVNPASSEPPAADLCSGVSNPGSLDVKKIDFTNNGFQYTTFGEDDQWFPFEQIETQIDVKNNGNNDVDNVEISWGLWDTRDSRWVIEMDDEDELDVKDGDTESITVAFSMDDDLDVDLDELGDQSDRYRLYVVAEGEVDDDLSTPTCVSDFEPASVVIESDFVILDNIQIPETVQCGQTVQVSADVWNIGDRDQDEVSLEIFGRESVLGINEEVSVGDLDAFDSQRVDFTFIVPKDAEEKNYNLVLQVNDEDNEVFQNDFDDDYAEFTVPFKVSGGCGAVADSTAVTASLVSGGKAGQNLVISSTITNNGATSATYLVSASEFAQWASAYEASPTSITVAPGSSAQVTFTFKVSNDASGQNTFYIELVSGNDVKRQPVSVSIEKAGLLSSITGAAAGSSGLIWGLGLLNVILIVAVIIVAVRALRK